LYRTVTVNVELKRTASRDQFKNKCYKWQGILDLPKRAVGAQSDASSTQVVVLTAIILLEFVSERDFEAASFR
jgi:hypothetical protein